MVNVKKMMRTFDRCRMRPCPRLASPYRGAVTSPSTSRGMTLVELLAVALILSLVTGAVLLLHAQSWHISHKDNKRLTAAHIAQYVLEEWMAVYNYEQVKEMMDKSPLTLDNDDVLKEIWDLNTDYQPYTPQIELAYADDDENRKAGPIRVTVTIINEISGIGSENDENKIISVTLHGIMAE